MLVVWLIVVFVVGEIWSLLLLGIAIVVVVEVERSEIGPGLQLICPSELKAVLKAIATISVWVCVCLFVAPV